MKYEFQYLFYICKDMRSKLKNTFSIQLFIYYIDFRRTEFLREMAQANKIPFSTPI